MQKKLLDIKKNFLKHLENIKDAKTLNDLETKYLGRKGELTMFLRGIVKLEEQDKKKIGKLGNEIKNELKEKIRTIYNIIESNGQDNFVDVSLPGKEIKSGHLHPVSIVQNDLEDLFTAMGFMVLEGPELESDFFNFTALNIPAYHPARDIQDTFYVSTPDKKDDLDLVMRTHTSPMQVRAMQKHGAPLKCVVPGRVFRNEATDAVHDNTFDQIEGLMIGENISLANLIAVLNEILNGIMEQKVVLRVRPGYFPFVEPGLEVDIKCTICGGQGCPSCKHLGWLEMLGAGMVHPKVLAYGGIDPEKYSGFAFGIGVTRLIMMKYGIDDIRSFNSGDLRFIEQF